jgi:AcrR family transcriptional regulator
MARRNEHSRDELRELALAAAWDIVQENGLKALTARGVAVRIGYSPGTLYNVFGNLDDLILHLQGRVLDSLHGAISRGPRPTAPEAALMLITRAYITFMRENPNLWVVLFEHCLVESRTAPDFEQVLGVLESALAPLFGPHDGESKRQAARVLWSSLHGICSLSASSKLGPVTAGSLDAMAESLVTNYLEGLWSRIKARS